MYSLNLRICPYAYIGALSVCDVALWSRAVISVELAFHSTCQVLSAGIRKNNFQDRYQTREMGPSRHESVVQRHAGKQE